MVKRANRVQETSTTAGTGTMTLAGAVVRYRTFTSAFALGDNVYYAVEDAVTNDWEVGAGTLLSATTISRDQVFSSSNANALVSFAANAKNIWCTDPAENQWPVVRNSTALTEVCTVPINAQMAIVNTFDNVGTLDIVGEVHITDATPIVASVIADTSGGFKNKIIGGNFSTNPWQYGTNFPAIGSGIYTADRFSYSKVGSMVHTASKSADAPSAAQAGLYTGFSHSLVVTAAQTTLAAGDVCFFEQRIEGINAASFGFGQAGVRTITKSFWVKMAKTGVHCVAFRNAASNRSYVAEYTIIAANTWEFKSITIPVDTIGTWAYDNTIGLSLTFALAVGTNFQTTANTWQTGSFIATANQVNELDTVGNTFLINLTQLEPGSTATPFETRSVGQEQALCEWYYMPKTIRLGGYHTAGNLIRVQVNHQTMRATPTINVVSTAELVNLSAVGRDSGTRTGFRLTGTVTATGDALLSQTIILDAEL